MVKDQYPDSVTYEDQNGNEVIVECRFIPVRGTSFFRKQDGTEVQYSYDIAFPLETEPILSGIEVTGKDKFGSFIVYKQELIWFHIGQMHCRGKM